MWREWGGVVREKGEEQVQEEEREEQEQEDCKNILL